MNHEHERIKTAACSVAMGALALASFAALKDSAPHLVQSGFSDGPRMGEAVAGLAAGMTDVFYVGPAMARQIAGHITKARQQRQSLVE